MCQNTHMNPEFVGPQNQQPELGQATLASEVAARLRRVNVTNVLGGLLIVSAADDVAHGHHIRAGIQAYVGLKLLNE